MCRAAAAVFNKAGHYKSSKFPFSAKELLHKICARPVHVHTNCEVEQLGLYSIKIQFHIFVVVPPRYKAHI